MNSIDPCSMLDTGFEAIDQEFSVDEVAAMLAVDTVPPLAAVAAAVAPIPIEPLPIPFPLIKRRVSGRYRGLLSSWELELRVDVDGTRPTTRISGDYFQVTGGTKTYFGSFVVNSLTLAVTSSLVTAEGIASTTWSTSFNKLRVTIPRVSIFQAPAPATALWMNAANQPGASYLCAWESSYFRSVELEQDTEQGVTAFASYNTGSLPSGGPARTLTVASSYGESGVEMRDTGGGGVIPVAPGSTWSNAELHASMLAHFSRWADLPQWKVWLLHAQLHDMGPNLYGIMFDQQGRQRQGCAVFYQSIGGAAADRQRTQLFTCVHELGHCFNLYHSFHKSYMTPPLPNRPTAMSWMNYPWNYPAGGPAAFWSAFPFQFDLLELIHLRHAYRNNIIIGGNPFGTGAALERNGPSEFDDPVEDRSGLQLLLGVENSLPLGTPVRVTLTLRSTDQRAKLVSPYLDPKFGVVKLGILKPNGATVEFEHPIHHCIDSPMLMLAGASAESTPVSAYVGYDAHVGQVFDQAGLYTLRAAYPAPDGSIVVSNLATIFIRPPVTAQEAEAAELLLRDDVGMLFALEGSDSPSLTDANAALDEVLAEHASHPGAASAALVKGLNAAREFKIVEADDTLTVREAQPDQATTLLRTAADAGKAGTGLDPVTTIQTLDTLSKMQPTARATQATKKEITDFGKQADMTEEQIDAILSDE
jgi:hypothetical protein